MERKYGTCVFGVRTPIIEKGDDLVKIAIDSTLAVAEQRGLKLSNNDILGITEAVVAKSQNNYATMDDIATDVRTKFDGKTVGVVHPILSRNRFLNILEGIAKGVEKVYVLLNHVDEQGNALSKNVNLFKPDTDFYTSKEYMAKYGKPEHSITKQDYIELYENTGKNVEVLISPDPATILNKTDNVIAGTVHNRNAMKDYLIDSGAKNAYTLADILSEPVNGSGFNPQYGVLGSNKAGKDLKLFPRDCDEFVYRVQEEFARRIGVSPEIMVYGDGAFKCPKSGIWELADPVVSPGFTEGRLDQIVKGDTKLKNVADEQLIGLSRDEKEKRMNQIVIENKEKAGDGQLGTTPRVYSDLVGSAMDLVSGSGNKKTPVVLVTGYFDDCTNEEINLTR